MLRLVEIDGLAHASQVMFQSYFFGFRINFTDVLSNVGADKPQYYHYNEHFYERETAVYTKMLRHCLVPHSPLKKGAVYCRG